MMMRRAAMKLAGALALLVGVGISQNASATEVIKIGTLAPKASPWGQVFTVWEKAVKEKSNGAVELQFFYNGQQGDEGAMVGKMKAGQLDGAAVTAVGLGKIYKPISALQMPGLFTSWAKLDAARDAMKGEFEKGLNDNGFMSVGWGVQPRGRADQHGARGQGRRRRAAAELLVQRERAGELRGQVHGRGQLPGRARRHQGALHAGGALGQVQGRVHRHLRGLGEPRGDVHRRVRRHVRRHVQRRVLEGHGRQLPRRVRRHLHR